jgi:exosome complex RNA-binding protein Rrp42 (RNase PH superfamily)
MALTRTTEQHEELVVKMGVDEAFAASTAALAKVGKVQSSQKKFGRIVGKVRSGHMNMNRADITIRVEEIDGGGAKLIFDATAQEGLVSQNTAAKAITRVLDSI